MKRLVISKRHLGPEELQAAALASVIPRCFDRRAPGSASRSRFPDEYERRRGDRRKASVS